MARIRKVAYFYDANLRVLQNYRLRGCCKTTGYNLGEVKRLGEPFL